MDKKAKGKARKGKEKVKNQTTLACENAVRSLLGGFSMSSISTSGDPSQHHELRESTALSDIPYVRSEIENYDNSSLFTFKAGILYVKN